MIEYWFLPAIILLGLITAYEDYRYGKIRNKILIYAILYGLVMYAYLFFVNKFRPSGLFFLNIFIALILSFVIWYFEYWSAGDAKLYGVFVFLSPIQPSENLFIITYDDILINTFLPLIAFYIFLNLKSSSIENLKNSLIKSLEFKSLVKLFLGLFVLIWLINIVFSGLIPSSLSLAFLIAVTLGLTKFKFIKTNKFLVILVIVSFIRILLDKTVFEYGTWIQFLIIFLAIFVLRFILQNNGIAYIKEVELTEVTEGMIPSNFIVKEKGKFKKISIKNVKNNLNYYKDKLIYPFPSRGLTNENIESLKSIADKADFSTIRIRGIIHLAPFLFFAAMMEIFLHENIIGFLLLLL